MGPAVARRAGSRSRPGPTRPVPGGWQQRHVIVTRFTLTSPTRVRHHCCCHRQQVPGDNRREGTMAGSLNEVLEACAAFAAAHANIERALEEAADHRVTVEREWT